MKYVRKLWVWLGLWALAMALVAIYWHHPVRISLLVVALTVVGLVKDLQKGDEKWWMVFAVGGFASEGLMIIGGAWKYAGEWMWGLPIWLPVMYGLGGLTMRRLLDVLVKPTKIKKS